MAKKTVQRPNRDPDHYSKRDVPYWWAPEWVRGTSADVRDCSSPPKGQQLILTTGEVVMPCPSYGKIHAIKVKGDVELHMKSKDGNLSYIQGSIQKEFKRWHEDRSIDYLLFGLDPDDIIQDDN